MLLCCGDRSKLLGKHYLICVWLVCLLGAVLLQGLAQAYVAVDRRRRHRGGHGMGVRSQV